MHSSIIVISPTNYQDACVCVYLYVKGIFAFSAFKGLDSNTGIGIDNI